MNNPAKKIFVLIPAYNEAGKIGSVVSAYHFFGEKLTIMNWAGIFIIMIGVSLVSTK